VTAMTRTHPASGVDWVTRLSDVDVKLNEPLAPWCSVRVGGPAEALARPKSPAALLEVLRLAKETATPVNVLGLGANTLVGDEGVPGLTLKLPASTFEERVVLDADGATLTLSAGAAIARLVTLMKQHGLVGAEFLAGVPGTIGGATTMNAGTKHGECLSRVISLELATAEGLGWVEPPPYRYRHTEVPSGAVITRVTFRLPKGDVEKSQALMDADVGYRKRTQPLSQPNFGSVFTNPEGHFAGALIEQVALKGHRVGHAQFSTQHANWIVNLGGATAKDVTDLMALAQQRVLEASGVTLNPEVKRLGVFTP